jgi:hypothetical protein
MGVSKSFSYQVTKNAGVAEVLAYTSAISYGTGDIFPNAVYGNACMIPEEKTRGNVINAADMINVSSTIPLEVPADGADRWVYVLFQSYPGRWRVVGARIVDKLDFNSSSAYVTQNPGQENGWVTGSDVPLLGENLPGEPVVSSAPQDAALRDRLVAAYRQKMQGNPTGYSDMLPVHVVRYRLRGHAAVGSKILQAFARVGVEPPLSNFPADVTSEVSFGTNVNRAGYPSYSGAWLHVRYVAP